MKTQLIDFFYENIGYVAAYSGYFILFAFLISPSKIKLFPFYLFFINTVISIIFDGISLVLHSENLTKYFDFILPFYAINNVIFIGLFLIYYSEVNVKKYLQFSTLSISVILLVVYHLNGYESWSTWGSLIQSFTMISYLILTLRSLSISTRKIPNKRSVFYIASGLLLAYSVSLLLNIFFKSLMQESEKISHLFYGIKNIFWIFSNLLSAYAVYKIALKPTSSPKPSPLLPKLN